MARASVKSIFARKTTWLFVAPITDLVVTKEVGFEHRVDGATFVDASHVVGRRKRLGFPKPISEIASGAGAEVIRDALRETDTVVVLRRHTGKGTETRPRFIRNASDELAILTLSQLAYARRLNAAAPTLGKKSTELRSDLMLDTKGNAWVRSGNVRGKLQTLVLDGNWKQWQKTFFYFTLLKVLRGEVTVKPAWRATLRNAAIVAGRGYATRDVPEAFLANMIAIEMLLTTQGDKYSTELPRRAEAFIGWAVDWKDYSAKIRAAYLLRSQLVHEGRRDLIGVEDVLFTDMLLFNILLNVCAHINMFRSKGDVMRFAERRAAETLLGIDAKVRPKSLRFTEKTWRPKDLEDI